MQLGEMRVIIDTANYKYAYIHNTYIHTYIQVEEMRVIIDAANQQIPLLQARTLEKEQEAARCRAEAETWRLKVHTCMYACVYVRLYVCMYIWVRKREECVENSTHAHAHAYMHIYAHTYAHADETLKRNLS
jgi:hypothetical protein